MSFFPSRAWLFLFALFGACATGGRSAEKQVETVFIFENRKVSITVPEGCGFASDKDEEGLIAIRIGDRKETLRADIVFAPDPEGRYASARERKEKIVALFQGYVGDSVEKAMQFEELQPTIGAATYCLFTDSKLVGQKPPPGEFLHFATGLKAWPGVVAIFRVFTNDTSSKEFKGVMAMLKESVHERLPPLKP